MNNHDLFLVIMTATGVLMMMIGVLNVLLRRDEIKKLPNLIADCEEALKAADSDQEYLDDAGEPAFETGLTLLNMGKYKLAIVEFTKSLQANPKHRNAELYRGFARYKLEDYEAAVVDFDKVPRDNPKYTAACFFRGMALRDDNQADDNLAIASFEKAILADPSGKEIFTVGSFNERGKVHHNNKDYDRAIVDFGKVNATANRVVKPHQLTDAVYRRGKAFFKKNQFDKAIEDMKTAVQRNPKHSEALHWLGKAHFKEDHFEDAVKFLEDAVKFLKEVAQSCPDTAESKYWYWLGRAYLKTEKYGESIDALTNAIHAIKKNKPSKKQDVPRKYYLLRGKAHRMIGNFKKAEADDRKAERLLRLRLVGFDDAPTPTISHTPPPPIDTGDSTEEAA